MIRNILLVTDVSPSAERAAEYTAWLASDYGAKVTVLHTVTPVSPHLSESNYRQAYYKTLTEAESLVADVAKHLKRMGVTDVVGTNIVGGSVVNVILNVAKIRKPDLLVMGAREPSIGQGANPDSISRAVAECAACPVMIVK